MKKSLTGIVLAVALAAGCSSARPGGGQPTGSTTSDIQGGTDDTTHTFAVGIAVYLSANEMAFCSGALLAPNLVATARHCAAAISSTVIDCATATFGADFTPDSFLVTTDATITRNSDFLNVSKVVTPPATGVCGNDLALLILSSNVNLPQYVTPILSPPMTDLSSEEITAIGYGIDSPLDDAGLSAGTRRIRQDIPILCIPNDPTLDCPARDNGIISPNEFQSTGGTCEGDSGSSAYDEQSFDEGTWKSFGVLSRGGVSEDGTTCEGAIYTQFDAYGSLLIDTALQAAAMGGYQPPAWTGAPSTADAAVSSTQSDAASGGSTSSGTSSGARSGTSSGTSGGKGGDGANCSADTDCASDNCITDDDGGTYFCATSCSVSSQCPTGFSCEQTFCIASPDGGQPSSSGGKSGCAVASLGSPTEPVPWRSFAAGLAAMTLFAKRRRRR